MSTAVATERPWVANYDRGVPHTLDTPAVPLRRFLSDTAARHPRAIATIFGAVVAGRLVEASLTDAEPGPDLRGRKPTPYIRLRAPRGAQRRRGRIDREY